MNQKVLTDGRTLDFSTDHTIAAVHRTAFTCYSCSSAFPVEIYFDVGGEYPIITENVKCRHCLE